MDTDGRGFLFARDFYEAKYDLGRRHCFGSVLGRPDSTTAYSPYGRGRPAMFNAGRPPQGVDTLDT